MLGLVNQHPGAVQLPGVVGKRPSEPVPADVNPPVAEAALGDEGMERLEMGGRGPVGGRWAHRQDLTGGSPAAGRKGTFR
jgi:hypothetical protein